MLVRRAFKWHSELVHTSDHSSTFRVSFSIFQFSFSMTDFDIEVVLEALTLGEKVELLTGK